MRKKTNKNNKLINVNDETLLLTYFLIHYTQYTIIPEKVDEQKHTYLLTSHHEYYKHNLSTITDQQSLW